MVRPTTVLAVVPLPPPMHGASKISLEVVRHLRSNPLEEVDVHVIDTGVDRSHIRGRRYHLRRMSAYAAAVTSVIRMRLQRNVIVYVGGAGGLGLWYQALVVAVARLTRSEVVWHHHSYSYLGRRPNPAMRIIAELMRRRGTGIYLSRAMRERFELIYAAPKAAAVCSNVFSVELAAPRSERSGPVRLIHVSNMSREKGSLSAISIFRQLHERGHDVELALVGPGTDEVQSAIDETRQDGYPIKSLGPMESDRVRAELDDAHFFLFPSTYVNEAEPLVVLEALARGVPVVCTDRGSLGEIVPYEWLVSDTDSAVTTIGRLLEEPWEELSGQARSVIECLEFNSRRPDAIVLDVARS